MEKFRYALFLDDYRNPPVPYLEYRETQNDTTEEFLLMDYSQTMGSIVVRDFKEFVEIIQKGKELGCWPLSISLDHDLAEEHYGYQGPNIPYSSMKEPTGWHCLKWLLDNYPKADIKEINIKFHSLNKQGVENMKNLLKTVV